MPSEEPRKPARMMCLRFGTIAVDLGFIRPQDLIEALEMQVTEDLAGNPHRSIGTILLARDLLSSEQVDAVLKVLFTRRPAERDAAR